MPLFELIQLSDPITFEASNPIVAGFVGLILGTGKAGVRDERYEVVLPILIFGGVNELEQWASAMGIEGGQEGMKDYADAHLDEIIQALRTMAVCSMADRKALMAAVGDDPEALARWNEAKRSSMNDWCGFASDIADAMQASRDQAKLDERLVRLCQRRSRRDAGRRDGTA